MVAQWGPSASRALCCLTFKAILLVLEIFFMSYLFLDYIYDEEN
jgi:hypothetical protein